MKPMRTAMTRRTLLGAAAALPVHAQSRAAEVAAILQVNDLDRRIWQEELEEFVPKRIWDMHSHLGLYRFDTDPNREKAPRYALNAAELEKHATIDTLQACNELLYPGRSVTPFVLPNPYQHCDCMNLNEWAAAQARQVPKTVCAMVVKPEMTADYVDKQIRQRRFIGFKPYMWYARIANWREARITDFLPEHQVEVANQYGLIMSVHLSKRAAISDPENLADLARLARAYPRVRWMLLHNARSYAAWAMERAAPRLRDIPNVWLESSSVCEADAFHATFTLLGVNRFCYGSDDIPVGITRGKYIAWGYGWDQLDSNKFPVKVTHCDGRMTFVRYEMLRAIKHAAKYAGLSKAQIDGIFHGNGDRLVSETQADLNRALGGI